jgi:hypothetical protein
MIAPLHRLHLHFSELYKWICFGERICFFIISKARLELSAISDLNVLAAIYWVLHGQCCFLLSTLYLRYLRLDGV